MVISIAMLNGLKYDVQKSSSKVAVGPIMLGFFLFVVVGSGINAHPSFLLVSRANVLISECVVQPALCCCSFAANHQDSNKRSYALSQFKRQQISYA